MSNPNSDMSSRIRKPKSKDRKRDKARMPIDAPTAYPASMPGYPVPPPQWMYPGFQYAPYYQPWVASPQAFSNTNNPWMHGLPSDKTHRSSCKSPTQRPDEFMVNALSRIYSNDDGSIEIERVKVHRRAPGSTDTKLPQLEYSPSSNATILNPENFYEKRPPPRKNKKKVEKATDIRLLNSPNSVDKGATPPFYPSFIPYMPQPYSYPPYPYMWPSPPPTAFECESLTDESESSNSRNDTLPSSQGSPTAKFTELRNSEIISSPDHQRAPSSVAGSQVTESQATDIAPSDSVSMGGYRKKRPEGSILRGSNRSSYTTDRASAGSIFSSDAEKTNEWMKDMKDVLASKMEENSDGTVDRTSFMTAHSDIPTPPLEQKPSIPPKLNHKKSNSESNIVITDVLRNNMSPPLFNNTRVSDTDLLYAFKKLENSADTFKNHVDHKKGRESRESTLSFHSTRQSAEDERMVDTDSTDIALPDDSPFGSGDNISHKNSQFVNDDLDFKWILQFSDRNKQEDTEETEDELKNNWRAEVSLWRAHLVVSLCKGQGLDQEDWNTFQLLVTHPLCMDKKLTLLHPQRICSLNRDLGVVFLRNALLHLTTYGEALLKPDDIRPMGWKTIPYNSNQLWYPVKGAIEILYALGYRLKNNGMLKHRRKYTPDLSVLARLTLDILVLTEELRLYLTGSHQYSLNISQIFAPLSDESQEAKECIETNASKNLTPPIVSQSNSAENNVNILSEARNKVEGFTDDVTSDNVSMATVSSLPELHSLGTATNQSIGSESSDSITPTGSPDIDSRQKSTTTTETHSKNAVPEANVEHVYEEINELKAQVKALKENKTVDNPPPLPPKIRSINGSFESPYSDTYSQLEVDSQCSSMQDGSVSSRRKKRRAPMPPSFQKSIKTSENSSGIESSKINANNKNLNDRIYKSKNPFYEDLKPLGYVGRNPFYETISIKKKVEKSFPAVESVTPVVGDTKSSNHHDIFEVSPVSKNESVIKGNEIITNISKDGSDFKSHIENTKPDSQEKSKEKINLISSYSLSFDNTDTNDDENSLNFAVRPQRKRNKRLAPVKAEPAENNKEESNVTNIKTHNSKLLNSEAQTDPSSIPSIKNEANIKKVNFSAPESDKQSVHTTATTSYQTCPQNISLNSKNEAREPQCHSQVAVPSSELEAEKKDKDVIIQKIFISYDICLKPPEINKPVIPEVPVKENNLLEIEKTQNDLNIKTPDNISVERSKIPIEEDKNPIDIFDDDDIKFIDSDEEIADNSEVTPTTEYLNDSSNNNNFRTHSITPLGTNFPMQPATKQLPKKDLLPLKNTIVTKIDNSRKENVKDSLQDEITDNSAKNNISSENHCSITPELCEQQVLSNALCQENMSSITSNSDNEKIVKANLNTQDVSITTISPNSNYETQEDLSDNIIDESCQTANEEILFKNSDAIRSPFNLEHSYTETLCTKSTSVQTNENLNSHIDVDLETHTQTMEFSQKIVDQPSSSHNIPDRKSLNMLGSSCSDITPPPLPRSSPPRFETVVFHSNNENSSSSFCEEREVNSMKEVDDKDIALNDSISNLDQLREEFLESTNSTSESKDMSSHEENFKEPLKKDVEEERYEIPDVTRAEAIDNEKRKQKISSDDLKSQEMETRKQSPEKNPQRPPRKNQKPKAPPLPPKSNIHASPPVVPPKSNLMTSSVNNSILILEERNTSKHRSRLDRDAISPSPLAIPSISPQSYTAPSLNRTSQSQLDRTTKVHYSSSSSRTATIRPQSAQPPKTNSIKAPYKSLSMPSSPKLPMKELHNSAKIGNTRKSWPFQLCTCVYAKRERSYDRVPYKR